MQHWHNVYDFADDAPVLAHVLFVLLPLTLLFIIWRHLSVKHSTEEETTPFSDVDARPPSRMLSVIIMCFAGIWIFILLPGSIVEYVHTRGVYKQKQYQAVTGVVTDFNPMPEGGHKYETFTVAGVPFAFSNFEVKDYGYNNASSHGGAIRAGLHVRIAYMANKDRNVILILDTLAAKPDGKR
ncbi:hypothetical protein [Hymenobacter perfusus]|uniref:DUF3592 domain-containing protein n=1 Tax=Hymenobacter perfusus TaxID=1236770 RepID=A0A3R9P0Y4_9BACT|nr:hypothetical protein [Hymenobacter perfusus]RSK46264.1 hypothetical protein EI293_03605 [Hymenobacter perfusus]